MKMSVMMALVASMGIGTATLAQNTTKEPKTVQPTKAEQPREKAKASAEIGKPAPEFELTDTDGKVHKLADYTKAGKIVVLEWFNPDCPVVKDFHENTTTMVDCYDMFKDQNVVWLAVNSGAPGKQGAGQERNAKAKADWKLEYPILLDESGKVGKAYGAKTTPHMFVIGADGTLAYMGALTDKGMKDKYVEPALKSLIAGETIKTTTTQSFGCNVKYGK